MSELFIDACYRIFIRTDHQMYNNCFKLSVYDFAKLSNDTSFDKKPFFKVMKVEDI